VARLVDEGMRMEDHPGIGFRDGPTGRRAGLASGPDVWEVIVALQDFATAGAGAAVAKTAKWLGLTAAQVRTAEATTPRIPTRSTPASPRTSPLPPRPAGPAPSGTASTGEAPPRRDVPPSIAEGLRRKGRDVVAVQETPSLRGLSDPQLFVAPSSSSGVSSPRTSATSSKSKSAWRAEHEGAHRGLILVAPGAFPRHQRRTTGRLIEALEKRIQAGRPEPGLVTWLESP